MSLSDDIGLPGASPSASAGATATVEASDRSERRPRSGPGEGLVLLLWAVAVIAAVVVVLMRSEHDELNDPVKKAARGEVTGLGPLSLLTPNQFGRTMLKISQRYPGGRIIRMRVDPVAVSTAVHTGGYDVVQLRVDPSISIDEDGTGETTEKGLAYSRIDATAPARLVRVVNRKTHTTPDDVDYVTLSVDSTRASDSRWLLFLKRGTPPDQRSYGSDLSGRHVKGNF